jgi:Glyoxalase superfamily protein
MTIQLQRIVSVFGIFSLEKAHEFYLDFLSFEVDWGHRFAPVAPPRMQISSHGLTIHLSEHHGDGTPGSSSTSI